MIAPPPSMRGMDTDIPYKYSENKILDEMKQYVDNTYSQHYAGKKNIQVFELIEQRGHGLAFCVGSIIKYAYRYGLKGGFNRSDLLKIIHYSMFLLHIHDTENKIVEQKPIPYKPIVTILPCSNDSSSGIDTIFPPV